MTTVPAATAPTVQKSPSILLAFGGACSALAAALATWWLVSPAESPVTDPALVIIATWAPPTTVALLILVTGAIGVSAAVLTRALRRPQLPQAAAALHVVVFGLALQGVQSISLAGYLMAMALPAALVLLLVQCVRRYSRLRWLMIAAAAALLAWGAATRALAPDHLGGLVRNLATGFATHGVGIALAAFFTTTAVTWAGVVARSVHGTSPGQRATAVVTRHRVLFTLIAAGGPLPYALARMTWFTPWPLVAPGENELGPEIRLWGLLLGGAALAGVVLTLGLIRPWGERFPRWMPVLAGRPVPVAAAAVPGGIVAAILCASAVPMLVQLTFTGAGAGVGVSSTSERVLAAFLFPFWIWGPMLALAVWGYVGHRRGGPDRPAVRP